MARNIALMGFWHFQPNFWLRLTRPDILGQSESFVVGSNYKGVPWHQQGKSTNRYFMPLCLAMKANKPRWCYQTNDQTVRGRVINRSLGFKRIEMEGHEDNEGCIRLHLSGCHGWLFARHRSHFWCRKSLSSASAWFASDCSHGGPHCTTESSLDE